MTDRTERDRCASIAETTAAKLRAHASHASARGAWKEAYGLDIAAMTADQIAKEIRG